MSNKTPDSDEEKSSSTNRRSFLKGASAVAGPVVFSETVRSASNSGKPLVLEVKTGYDLPNGLPVRDDVQHPLSATCSLPSYHVDEKSLKVTPAASQEEVGIIENEDKVVVSDGISKFSHRIWGNTEKDLRLNPEIGRRSVTFLALDSHVKSPRVQLNTLGDDVELQKPDRSVGIGTNQANGHQFAKKKVTFTASKSQNLEQVNSNKEGRVRSPSKEDIQFTVKVAPKVQIKNHGRLTVEKLSIGDKTEA